ncbi:hypothetical protein DRE_04691 [Drechslerella stenobrocha 248]|uniref:Conidiophore development protein hymA n=1 Tax=Drechslerella stenobrocha 248 TaxID=1043628 RepID=W7I0U0_9PEZI|nr:hypothetical protein DRE_04691 [Drechslerella stenobrocha 248]
MAFLFSRQKEKLPADAVRRLRDDLIKLDQGPAINRKAVLDDAIRQLQILRLKLQGSEEAVAADLLPLLAAALPKLDFESRKDSVAVFHCLLRFTYNGAQPTVLYLTSARPETIVTLVNTYPNSDAALNAGAILREAFKAESLARVALLDPSFWDLFTYVQGGRFDLSSDAFATFKELLTRHKVIVAEFLATRYDDFFSHYNALLNSDNYITKRQSIKLLGEILLDRANYNIMTAYVDSPDHLKLCMNLLRDKSRNVQYEAFHVFKVFVANPKKSKPVEGLLLKNREQLLRFLPKFHEDRKDDEQFADEKAFLIKQIEALGQPQPI